MDRKQLKAFKRVKKYIHDRNVKANKPRGRPKGMRKRRSRKLPEHYRQMERMTPQYIAKNTRQRNSNGGT